MLREDSRLSSRQLDERAWKRDTRRVWDSTEPAAMGAYIQTQDSGHACAHHLGKNSHHLQVPQSRADSHTVTLGLSPSVDTLALFTQRRNFSHGRLFILVDISCQDRYAN